MAYTKTNFDTAKTHRNQMQGIYIATKEVIKLSTSPGHDWRNSIDPVCPTTKQGMPGWHSVFQQSTIATKARYCTAVEYS